MDHVLPDLLPGPRSRRIAKILPPATVERPLLGCAQLDRPGLRLEAVDDRVEEPQALADAERQDLLEARVHGRILHRASSAGKPSGRSSRTGRRPPPARVTPAARLTPPRQRPRLRSLASFLTTRLAGPPPCCAPSPPSPSSRWRSSRRRPSRPAPSSPS